VNTSAARMRLHRLEALGLLKFEKPKSYLDVLAQTILYSNPDDTFRGRSHGYLVGPYGVLAICEALDKAGFEICRSAPTITELQAAGATSPWAIAAGLNERGIPTARGTGTWSATQVMRVLARL
jgi:hypothetical protein